jgi:hypothetical protein
MKTFKTFLSEAEKAAKPFSDKEPTSVDRARGRQDREKDELKTRQAKELEKARQDDFRKKEAETRQKEAQKRAELAAKKQESVESDNTAEYVPEYLEDGTLVLVKNYKANTPGQ